MINANTILKTSLRFIRRNKAGLLAGAGIISGVASCALSFRAGLTAEKLLAEERDKREKEAEKSGMPAKPMTNKEKIQTVWKCVLPPAMSMMVSSACIIAAQAHGNKKNAALAAAYALSKEQAAAYQNKVREEIGEEREKEIRDRAAQDTVVSHSNSNSNVVLMENSDVKCYDLSTMRCFYSTKNKIESAVNALNRRLIDEMYVSQNDFYDLLGLTPTTNGDDLGWNITTGSDIVRLSYSSILDETGAPCLAIDYMVKPRYDYYSFR